MKIEYIDHMGNDLTVVNAARVSFDLTKDDFDDKDQNLIRFLARGITNKEYSEIVDSVLSCDNKQDAENILKKYKNTPLHFTPFTHPQITLRETVPIFIARQRFKSQIGFSVNEVSRRYVSSEPDFYSPEKWREVGKNKKQGSSDEEITHIKYPKEHFIDDDLFETHGGFVDIKTDYEEFLSLCENKYRVYINSGVCPEQARMLLPQSMMTSYYITGSLAAFARVYNLRSESSSQKEIQFLSQKWNEIISPLYPVSWKALTNQ